ncbi:MAG TPA: 8-amino-7-oxononanoate synthase [Pyrinomonadaceae bacterium]|jgi:8-amino-7-oxononanoate synthase
MNLHERILERLSEIEAKNLKRALVSPRGIDLSSNDYLGLAKDARLKNAMIEGVLREGVGSTGSRLLRGERDCFREVERQFAAWKNSERALYFNSGYQANIGVLQTFPENGDVVFSDEFNHASLIDGIRLSKCRKIIFRHLDFENLSELLRKTECEGQKFLVTESLFSMDGDIAPLEKYAEICLETNTNLIVDEAHAVGVYGEKGSGLIEEFGIESDVFLSINTAGKALGVAGAFVAGSDSAIEYLIQKARAFIFSTAPVPAIANALIAAIEIAAHHTERRDNLLRLSKFLREKLNENGIEVSPDNSQIIPIIIGESEKAVRIAGNLQAKNFDVRAIRPPTVPENTSRLRVSLNANLTEKILEDFVAALKEELK